MSEIQDIKDRILPSEIIGRHVKLTPAGIYQKGLCPFHHEKTPSFYVNDQLGFYKCFGCGEGGDVFDFLQKYEGMTFREALETLAQQAGVTLTSHRQTKEDILRAKVLEILSLAADFYQKNLSLPVGQKARDYLHTRGTNQMLVKLFKLGASSDRWQDLVDFLQSKKYTREQILASGLARSNHTGRLYDTFRDRLMFPLRNHRGQVVGFSGRQLTPNPNEGKYINTPETMVYHKGKMLYGLYEFNKAIRQNKKMLIVEGEFDVLSSAQAGVDYVCAIKGSALTHDHADMIARYTDQVLLSLDADAAGIKATKKAIAALRPLGIDLRVVMIEGGKDPDEFAKSDPAAWRQHVQQAVSVYEFFITVITKQYDLHTVDGQKKILQELGSVFALIDNRLEYEYYLKKVAQILDQDIEVVRSDLKRWAALGDKAVAPAVAEKPAAPAKKRVLTKLQKLEAYLWFLFLQCLLTQTDLAVCSDYIIHTPWHNPFLQKLATAYQTYYRTHPQPSLKEWNQTLPEDFQQKIAILSLNKSFIKLLGKSDLTTEWQRQERAHRREVANQQISELTKKLARLETIDDPTLEQEKEKNELVQQIVNLKKGKQ